MELFWVMAVFFVFITIVFVVLAILFPETFGITGKKALEIQDHQQAQPLSQPANAETPTSQKDS